MSKYIDIDFDTNLIASIEALSGGEWEITHEDGSVWYRKETEDGELYIRDAGSDAWILIGKTKEFVWRSIGTWTISFEDDGLGGESPKLICSECEMDKPHATDYCPNCGAKMKG